MAYQGCYVDQPLLVRSLTEAIATQPIWAGESLPASGDGGTRREAFVAVVLPREDHLSLILGSS
jgi:hypothetical protein